jgi:hypothetical protein
VFANDPHAKTRFGIVLMWETGILLPVTAVSILLQSRNMVFHLWHNERVIFMIASGAFILSASYLVPQVFEALEKNSFKRKLLLFFGWWMAVLVPVALFQYAIMLSVMTLPIPVWCLIIYIIWVIFAWIVARKLASTPAPAPPSTPAPI